MKLPLIFFSALSLLILWMYNNQDKTPDWIKDPIFATPSPTPPTHYHENTRITNGGGGLDRFENDEVICYQFLGFRSGGLSCVWKFLLPKKENEIK